MDLKRLRLLSDLSLLGTITKVAEKHGRTRPAISQQLSLLELEVGAVLFDRSGRGVKLTATGQRLIENAAPVFALLESIQSEVNLAQEGDLVGEIRLCAFGSAIGALLPYAIKILAQKHPGLRIHITEQESRDGLKAVATHQADIAIVHDLSDMGFLTKLLEIEPLCSDDFVAVLSCAHPLAHLDGIRLEDLAQDLWAINTASEPYHSLLINACSERGFSPSVRASCRNMLATLALVRDAGYVAILPYFGAYGISRGHDVKLVKLLGPIRRNVRIAIAKGRVMSPAYSAVVEALHASAKQLSSSL